MTSALESSFQGACGGVLLLINRPFGLLVLCIAARGPQHSHTRTLTHTPQSVHLAAVKVELPGKGCSVTYLVGITTRGCGGDGWLG
jgi:hypothetical protein